MSRQDVAIAGALWGSIVAIGTADFLGVWPLNDFVGALIAVALAVCAVAFTVPYLPAQRGGGERL